MGTCSVTALLFAALVFQNYFLNYFWTGQSAVPFRFFVRVFEMYCVYETPVFNQCRHFSIISQISSVLKSESVLVVVLVLLNVNTPWILQRWYF